MDDHVGKPFVHAELIERLQRHLRRQGSMAPSAAPTARAQVATLPAATPLIDRDGAIARLGGDQSLYQRLIPSFREELRRALLELPKLPDRMPREEATRLLHTLKSTAATLGAHQLAALAAQAEGASKEAAAALDRAILDRLGEAVARTLAAFEAQD